MKFLLLKYSIPLLYFLSICIVLLLLMAFLLYHQKANFESQNRLLIVQNDSIMAENIKLKNNLLEQQPFYRGKKAGLSSLK